MRGLFSISRHNQTLTHRYLVHGSLTLDDLRKIVSETENWPGDIAVTSEGYVIRYMEMEMEESCGE